MLVPPDAHITGHAEAVVAVAVRPLTGEHIAPPSRHAPACYGVGRPGEATRLGLPAAQQRLLPVAPG